MFDLDKPLKKTEYQIRYSKRAKNLQIKVDWQGRCEVVIPQKGFFGLGMVNRFIKKHQAWIQKQIIQQRKKQNKTPLNHQGVSVRKVTEETDRLLKKLLIKYQKDFSYSALKIRSYKTRWGSCDSQKKLCFHYKLSLLPENLAEYIVVHELSHTHYLNHSVDFWQTVEKYCPEYKQYRKALKKYLI